MAAEIVLLNFRSFSEYFHTSVPLKLIFVFVLNLMQVDITDRHYLNLNQARKATGNYWTVKKTKKTILKLPEKLKSIYPQQLSNELKMSVNLTKFNKYKLEFEKN